MNDANLSEILSSKCFRTEMNVFGNLAAILNSKTLFCHPPPPPPPPHPKPVSQREKLWVLGCLKAIFLNIKGKYALFIA